jgi:hypothetical protein
MNSAELDGRELEREDGGRGGVGEAAVAKSIVAISSLFPAGAPQDEQKRTVSASSVPHEKHLAMNFPLQDTSDAWE